MDIRQYDVIVVGGGGVDWPPRWLPPTVPGSSF